MSDAGGHKAATKAPKGGAAARDERRAAALRANLARRKQQAREKALLKQMPPGKPGADPGSSADDA